MHATQTAVWLHRLLPESAGLQHSVSVREHVLRHIAGCRTAPAFLYRSKHRITASPAVLSTPAALLTHLECMQVGRNNTQNATFEVIHTFPAYAMCCGFCKLTGHVDCRCSTVFLSTNGLWCARTTTDCSSRWRPLSLPKVSKYSGQTATGAKLRQVIFAALQAAQTYSMALPLPHCRQPSLA